MKKYILVIAVLLATGLSSRGATWHVGASRTYKLPSQVSSLIADGDSIVLDSGTYMNDAVQWTHKNLVFFGLGTGNHRTTISWNTGTAGYIPNGKGIWVFGTPGACDNEKIVNIVFNGAQVSDANGGNGAGIRFQASNLTVDSCKFMYCQNGILEGGTTTRNIITIENSEFAYNGYTGTDASLVGYEHNMYISANADTFLLKNCYMHDILGEGNEIKTRAQVSFIEYNLVDEGNGSGSWECDIAQGGLTVILGNTFIQGPNSSNHGMIGWDAVTNKIEELYFVNNTVVNQYPGNGEYFNVVPASGITVFKVYNNCFANNTSSTFSWLNGGTGGATLDSSNNRIEADYTKLGFVNPVYPTSNYNLTASSTALINNGTSAGSASNGFPLSPAFQYVNNLQALAPRTVVGSNIDIGAYEFGITTGINELTDHPGNWYVSVEKGRLYVYFKDASLRNIQIVDIRGRIILQKGNVSQTMLQFPLAGLSPGVYCVRVEADEEVYSTKFVVNSSR